MNVRVSGNGNAITRHEFYQENLENIESVLGEAVYHGENHDAPWLNGSWLVESTETAHSVLLDDFFELDADTELPDVIASVNLLNLD